MEALQAKIKSVLKSRFGFDEFRGVQEPVILRALENKSSLVVMPTGAGKSLCYQLPSLVFDGVTLVISPLIALMKDQVDAAKKKGIRCCFINSSLSYQQRQERYKGLAEGKYQLVYVTPERFKINDFRKAIKDVKVSLLAIDEAHCISQWGHDFRPDYSRIMEFIGLLKNPPVMALTATATPEVQDDIARQIGEAERFISGVKRDNLEVNIVEVLGINEKIQHIVGEMHNCSGPAIIYCALISTLEKLSESLSQLNIEHTIYHGRLPDRMRKKNQEIYLNDKSNLILATPAFGLGINKENIRLIIHAEVPSSIEAYYQEIGRAGRDSKPAKCLLLYDGDDLAIQMDFIKWANPDPGFIKSLYNLICDYQDKIKTMGIEFLREKLNFYNRNDFRLETALNLLERWECIELNLGKRHIKVINELPMEFLDKSDYEKRLMSQNKKLLEMVRLKDTEECRKKFIYNYFGLAEEESCGNCDICLNRGER